MAPQKRSRIHPPKRTRTTPVIHPHTDNTGNTDSECFWKVKCSEVNEAKRLGRPPKFSTPELLWKSCQEYFQWVNDHPFHEQNAAAFKGDITKYNLTKKRPMTIGCLCLFLDFDYVTWLDYRANKSEDFSRVCQAAEQTIREQKFMGAAAGFFNHAIIARDLGLVDKKDLTSSDGSMTPKVAAGMSPKEAMQAYQEMVREGKQ